MAGHVFITRGDLTKLACDAWLMPCDWRFRPRKQWYANTEEWEPPESPANGTSPEERVREVGQWPKDLPQPWLVDVGGHEHQEIGWYSTGVERFLEVAAPSAQESCFISGRAKPLLALPLVGTGGGGALDRAGQAVSALLPIMYRAARRYDVDIALITYSAAAYASALNARGRQSSGAPVWPEELDEPLRDSAERLAKEVRHGRLVLFMGAGVSVGANVPVWSQLLHVLARRAGIQGGDAAGGESPLSRLDLLDQARIIARRLDRQGRNIGDEVSQIVAEHRCYALSHALLASLPVTETVTTNYDRLFEDASEAVGESVAVLPYSPACSGSRWLLKMHGCVSQQQDIVLTRSDYLRYDERRAALRGIVQAMLITRHMLFIGFSLTDDSFHRIIDDVRKAVQGERPAEAAASSTPSSTRFATCLSIENSPLLEELWSDDLDWVRLSGGQSSSVCDIASAARLQEVYLDYLASKAVSTTAHLMDDKYDAVLTQGERDLRKSLSTLLEDASDEAKRTAAWHLVRSLIGRLGG